MLILDNVIFTLQRYGGISNYWTEIQENLSLNQSYIGYRSYITQNVKSKHLIKSSHIHNIRNATLGKFDLLLPRKFSKNRVYHSSYYTTSNAGQNIVTVHDFTHEILNIGNPLNKLLKFKSLKNASDIVCISKSTCDDLKKIYPEIYSQKKIHIIFNGVSKEYKPIESIDDFENYIVFIGDRSSYKNFNVFLNVCSITALTGIVIGGGPFSKKELKKTQCLNIIKYDYLEEKEINVILNKAIALIYPSQYEGFGIPIIEAQKANCPVIISDAKACVEISGHKKLIAYKLENYVKLISMLVEVKDFRMECVDLGKNNSELYDWDKTRNQYLNLYNECLKSV